ncbi:MAG TPA: aromatic-ring-hydroxylating dioxygenase subunit beta [Alphaproteobacteria bacterium]|nr:aromatic-ring-hydroxylating dioxygenase subunit beta [Alphaproteobacteria bacterium]
MPESNVKSADATAIPAALVREIEDFVADEAHLLDQGRFEPWLALFAEDGMYWMPSRPGQTDPLGVPSIFYEDKEVLAIRLRRVAHPANLAQAPLGRTSHLLGRIRIENAENGLLCAHAPMHVVEYRDGDGQRVFGGTCTYHLRRENGQLKIVLKRVDIVNCDAPHSFITIPF